MADNTIDRLSLEVSSDASKAVSGIDRLVRTLDRLSTSVNGIDTTKFYDLSNGLNRLGNIKFDPKPITNMLNAITRLGGKSATQAEQNIPKLTSLLSALVAEMNNVGGIKFDTGGLTDIVSSISKLGGKGATNAIPNIKNLSVALKDMMATLSKAPSVSQNVINMTNAMANLSRNGANVTNATKALTGGIGSYTSKVDKAKKSTNSLTSSIAKLYAGYFTITRGIRALGRSFESASDYIETLNYFYASFGQVANRTDVDAWKNYGFASAEAYANSFQQRARELSKKLTGFNISETGDLTRVSTASLGLDPDKVLQYQSTFAQMASSMGAASEQSLKLSNALTMIGADLASVRNLEFEDVWQDMASGMVGMSRTLDKYGVNIRNTNLQQELYNLGIDKTISKLGQQDKAILRTIVLLNSTQYAWGDLANTISQPANQLRLLQANFSSLSRTIGSLFLPIVSKTLPYINAFVISLQRLFAWMAKLLGIQLSDFSSSVGGSAFDMGELADESDEAAEGISDAADNAKKLEKTLSVLPFDELNQLSEQPALSDADASVNVSADIGTMPELNKALDEALSNYQKVWDKAFSEMENRANMLADNISDVFKRLAKAAEPTTDAIKRLWSDGFSKLSAFNWDTIKDFWNNFLKPMGDWVLSDEAGLPRFFNITNDLLNGIDWNKLNSYLEAFFTSLQKPAQFAWTALMDFYEEFLKPVAQWTIGDALPQLISILTDMNNEIDWNRLNGSLKTFWGAVEPFAESIGEGLIDFFRDLSKVGIKFINKIPDGLDGISSALKKIKPKTVENIGYSLGIVATGLIAFKGLSSVSNILTKISSALSGWNALKSTFSWLGAVKYVAIAGGIVGLIAALDKFGYIDVDWGSIGSALSNIVETAAKFTAGIIQGVLNFADGLLTAFGPVISGAINLASSALSGFFGILSSIPSEVISGITTALLSFFAAWGAYQVAVKIGEVVNHLSNFRNAFLLLGQVGFEGIKEAIGGFFSSLAAHPYALIAAGIAAVGTAIFAAFTNAKKKVDEMITANVGESIKQSLTNPGGTPIEEVAGRFSGALDSAASGFTKINESSSQLDTANKNIEDTWTEIQRIETAMDSGVLSVEEGKKQLDDLFGQLATLTETKFQNMETTILAAYGEGGALHAAMKALGVDVEGAIDTVIEYGYRNQQEAKRISEEMQKYDYGTPKYKELEKQLIEVAKGYDDFSKATSDFSYEIGQIAESIDYSAIVFDDGTVDKEAVQRYANQVKDSLQNYNNNLDEAAKTISAKWDEIYRSPTATEEEKKEAKENLDVIPRAIEELKSNAQQKATEFTDMMQADFVGGVNKVIDQAAKDWEKMSWDEKILSGFQSKDEYVQNAVKQWKTNTIDPLSESIEEIIGGIGIKGAGWSSDAAKNIIDGLFDTITTYSYEGVSTDNIKMKDDVNSVINKALSDVGAIAIDAGKTVPQGFGKGIEREMSSALYAAKSLGTGALGETREAIDSHSPSKEYEKIGKDVVLGFNLGITKNTSLTTTALSQWLSDAKKVFSGSNTEFKNFGENIFKNFKDGIDGMKSQISNSAQGIINAVANTFSGINNDMYNYGRNAAQSFANGFSSVHIPTPHLYISRWNYNDLGNGNRVEIPEFDVDWYKTGGFFGSPSVVGVGDVPEVVLPLENQKVMRMIGESITSQMPNGFVDNKALQGAVAAGYSMAMMNNQQPINVNCYAELKMENDEALARAVARGQRSLDYRYNPTPKYGY